MKIINHTVLFLLFSPWAYAVDEKVDEKTSYHLAVSATAGYLTETILHQSSGLSDAEKIIYATVPVIGVGIIKELEDKEAERADVIANVVGAFAGAYLSNYINKNYFFKLEHEASFKKTQLTMGYRF